jgi:hypothetical protein
MNTRRLLVLAVLLPLAGCGGDDGGSATTTPPPAAASTTPAPSPSVTPSARPDLTGMSGVQLSAKARTALMSAKSLRVYGTIIETEGPLTLDMRYGRTGTTATIISEGQRVEAISIGNVGYLKGSETFWRAIGGQRDGQAMAALLAGRWLKGKLTDKEFGQFAELLRINEFRREITSDWPKSPEKFGVRTINGIQCIGLAGPDGVLWVDKYTARPVQIGPELGSKDKSRMNFGQYDAVQEPVAPPPSTVIDTSKLR